MRTVRCLLFINNYKRMIIPNSTCLLKNCWPTQLARRLSQSERYATGYFLHGPQSLFFYTNICGLELNLTYFSVGGTYKSNQVTNYL